MSKPPTGTILDYLRELSVRDAYRDHSDRQLLERLETGDQSAFALLLKRHGRMVWDVCRRTLGDDHDAEDAFQAVFMVLAYKANSVRRAESLGSWLHGVALRTAMNAKRKAARRRKHEQRHTPPPPTQMEAGIEWKEVQTLLDEEVQRLPAASRAVFVTCCMEGKSLADAARELGKTEGATAVALSRARKRLKQGLIERGVELGSVLAFLALTGTESTAAVPVGLFSSTIRAAAIVLTHKELTAGVLSESVAVLAKAMIKEMTHVSMMKLSLVAAVLIVTSALAGGSVWLSASNPAELSEPPVQMDTARPGGAQGEKIVPRIVWGKTVDGLQAGLEVVNGRTCRLGESVSFVVWVRNVGDKPVKLAYRTDWFYTSPPVVVDAGKSVKVIMPPKPNARQLTFELTLRPGEEGQLGAPELAISPAELKGAVVKPTIRGKPNAYKVRYEGLSLRHPDLTTGQVETVVQRGTASKKEEKKALTGNALKLAGSTWRAKKDGGEGPTYNADGTGRNHDMSKFEWRVEGDYLLVRRQPETGKPEDWSYIPIVFSRDGKEYRIILDDQYSLFRVSTRTGKPEKDRTEEGRQFRRRWVPEDQDNEKDESAAPRDLLAPNSDEVKNSEPEHGRDFRGTVRVSKTVNETCYQQVQFNDDVKPVRKEGALTIGSNVHVSRAKATTWHQEVTMAVDPSDARRMVAASMYAPPHAPPDGPADWRIVVYTSSDGGKSWALTLDRSQPVGSGFADPTFAWGSSDSLFFVNMRIKRGSLTAGRLQLVHSRDGGKTWEEKPAVTTFHDRPYVTFDNTGGKRQGWLYCLTHKGLLVSDDAATSFQKLPSLAVPPGFANPVILSDGSLVILYNKDVPTPGAVKKSSGHLAIRVSADGGESFSSETRIAEYRSCRFRTLAVAPPGTPWPDRIAAVWEDELPSGKLCVKCAHSTDRGASFSRSELLSEQPEVGGNYDAFLPSVSVNRAGVIAVTWYDTRGLPAESVGWNVRVRVSRDGGQTWEPSIAVTDKPTRLKIERSQGWVFRVGDTAGLAADANGVFHCLWADGRSGISQVYTAAVRVEPRRKP